MVTMETRGDNILDLILTNIPEKVNRVATLPPLSTSDHDVVFVEMNITLKTNRKAPRKIYKYHKANWAEMKAELNSTVTNLLQEGSEDVEYLWNTFKEKIISLRDKYVPSKMAKGKHHIPWITPSVRRQMRRRDKYYKLWRKTDKHKLEVKYKHLRSETQKSVRHAYWQYIDDLIDPSNYLETEHRSRNFKKFWSFVKALKRDQSGVSPLKYEGNLETTPVGKANTLNHQFKSVFVEEGTGPIPNKGPSPHPVINDITITENGVAKLLSKLNVNKASGPDEVNARMLKELKDVVAPFLTHLFQISLDTGVVPKDWRGADVSPIYKKGERYIPANYRPVSLTSITCKLMEHILVSQIMSHAEQNNILYDLQYGFRSKRSGDVQLLQLYHDLAYGVHRKHQTDLAIMDFAKAFDTVPHKRLLYKLEWYGINGKVNNWVKAFLSDRVQRVVVDGFHSDLAAVTSGVPQGSVLGPCLFLFYINDLPDYTNHTTVRLFADDCILYRVVKNTNDCMLLQEDLLGLERWEADWLMSFNAGKCSIMSATLKLQRLDFDYRLHGEILERCDNSKYLGVTIQSNLQWDDHIGNICKKASRTLGVIRRNLQVSSKDLKERAYLSLVRPQLEYSCTVWDPYKKKNIAELDSIQRRAARYVFNRYHQTSHVSEMLEELGWESLQSRRTKLKMCMAYKGFNDLCSLPLRNYVNFASVSTRNKAHQFAVIVPYARVDAYKFSFVPNFGTHWNTLPVSAVTAPSLKSFKAGVEGLIF